MTIVYKYGLRPPTLNADLVDEQMQLNHEYHNELRRHEGTRRDEVRQILGEKDGDVQIQAVLAEQQALYEELVSLEENVKVKRVQSRSKRDSQEDTVELKELRKQLKAKKSEVKDVRKAVALTDVQAEQMHAAQGKCFKRGKTEKKLSGVYVWTAEQTQQAMEASKGSMPLWSKKDGRPSNPRWVPWAGEGLVAIRVHSKQQVCVEETLLSTGTQVQFDMQPLTEDITVSNRSKKRRFGTLRLRVGTVEGKQTPIWAEWPILMHRPLPTGSVITNAKVTCKKIADRKEWSLHVTLKLSKIEQATRKDGHGTGAVAMDLGWRKFADEDMRVAYFLDDQGHAHDFKAEPGVLSGFRKVEDLISIRKQALNAVSEDLRTWLKSQDLPDWLKGYTRGIQKWEARGRFMSLLKRWSKQRWAGDEKGYNLLDTWAYGVYSETLGRKGGGDQHLWQWERYQAKKSLRRRKDQYRRLAAELSKKYETLVLENFDLRDTQKNKKVEEKSVAQAAKYQQRVAACSELRTQLIQAFHSRGGRVFKVDPAYTSQKCSACGIIRKGNRQGANYVCEQCGAQLDADWNAAKNILGMYHEKRNIKEVLVKVKKSRWARVKENKKAKEEALQETARKQGVKSA